MNAQDRVALLAKLKANIQAEQARLERCYRLPLDRVGGVVLETVQALAQVASEIEALGRADIKQMRAR